MTDDVLAMAGAWIEADPDPETRAELQALVDAGAHEELADRMAGTLQFGTAGLRGRVEAGSNRMNRAVVIRATRGVAMYLLRRHPDAEPTVVVGRDARLSSEAFMRDTVGVLAAAGLRVRYFPDPVPTPLVAYAARRLHAKMAIVITASHNPRWDNGYKVYDANGAQIVPPTDTEIAAAIAGVGPARDVPRLREPYEPGVEGVRPVPDDVFASYLEDLARVRPPGERPRLRIVHTPLHGVGGAYVVEALTSLGGHTVIPVREQFDPDGHFPTVEFPNPEEPGALDLALAAAVEEGAHLVIANDPDTDRLAVAAPNAEGVWRVLSGNQIGVLLGDWILRTTAVDRPLVIESVVSTPMLASIAAAHGATHAATLTGFKWIWNAALDLEAAGEGTFVYGFEEALGYSVTPFVRDKDGIGAAVVFADLAATAYAAGRTVLDVLGELYRRHGLWVSTQLPVVRAGAAGSGEILAAVDRLAAHPPASLGDRAVSGVVDYRRDAQQRPRYLGAAALVELELGGSGRVLARPSGTEPKLKIYVDLCGRLMDGEPWERQASTLERSAAAVARETALAMGLAP